MWREGKRERRGTVACAWGSSLLRRLARLLTEVLLHERPRGDLVGDARRRDRAVIVLARDDDVRQLRRNEHAVGDDLIRGDGEERGERQRHHRCDRFELLSGDSDLRFLSAGVLRKRRTGKRDHNEQRNRKTSHWRCLLGLSGPIFGYPSRTECGLDHIPDALIASLLRSRASNALERSLHG